MLQNSKPTLSYEGNIVRGKKFIFIGGLHRSGTSLLHKLLRAHPEISGFKETGVREDEGQHLQSVYPPANKFGGPGRFAFDSRSHMNEDHPLATQDNAIKIFKEWSCHWDLSRRFLLEKSPPNIIRTRFLQKLFPDSRFIVILRHPLPVSYATQKWSKTSIPSLLEHTLTAYESFLNDMCALQAVYVLRYEDLINGPQGMLSDIFHFMKLNSLKIDCDVNSAINDKYFNMWQTDRRKWKNLYRFSQLSRKLERRANTFGYSLRSYDDLPGVPLLGPHYRTE